MRYRLSVGGILLLLCLFLTKMPVGAVRPDSDYAINIECTVTDAETVRLRAVLRSLPKSDDDRLYVFAMLPYQYDLEEAELVGETRLGIRPCVSFPMYDESFNKLYYKFAFASLVDGEYEMVTNPRYITNPEYIATNTKPRKERSFKSVQGEDFTNIWVGEEFVYSLDATTGQFMCQTGQKGTHYASPQASESDSHPVSKMFLMLNGQTLEGIQVNAAEFKKYATAGSLENFIIGNEVNTRTWNYEAWSSWEEYVRNYYQIFRVAYNAIKSENANARVFICLDQYWDANKNSKSYIDSKDFLEMFNELCKAEGDIDWSVSHHSYPSPLNYSKFWDMSGAPKGDYFRSLVRNDKVVTFQNLSVLTDYMQTEEMLNPDGEMRHIIISEIGATRSQGLDIQAATLCAEYMAAKLNGNIDEITFLLLDGFGMYSKTSGISTEMFENMDRDDEEGEKYRQKALDIIGVGDWSEILR